MKEFTRILTIEVTQSRKFGDEWADDVEKEFFDEKKQKESDDELKRMFQADDIHVTRQLFIRDDVEDDGSEFVMRDGKMYGSIRKGGHK